MTKDLPRAALIPLLLAAAGSAVAASSPVSIAAAHEAPRFGPYDLVRELGRGAMGAVYLAHERDGARREVALKVAHRAPASSELRAQLGFERQALAAVEHEHVVRLFDAGTTPDGHPWLAMEYIAGEPIDIYCARKALPLTERVSLLTTVARGVQHLHERGVVHRDLKPDNILVTEVDGRPCPKIIDLGLAALHGVDRGEATEHAVVGTPTYMAPELFTDPAPSLPRADVFALGVVAYELVAGASPFGGQGHGPAAIEFGRPTPPTLGARDARALRRAGLDAVLETALARDPGQRPADAGALALALQGVLARAALRPRWRGWAGRMLAALWRWSLKPRST